MMVLSISLEKIVVSNSLLPNDQGRQGLRVLSDHFNSWLLLYKCRFLTLDVRKQVDAAAENTQESINGKFAILHYFA